MGVPEPYRPKGEHKDPTEWRPRDNSAWEHVEDTVTGKRITSMPLQYEQISQMEPGAIAAIEANARGQLISQMQRDGFEVDERGVRIRWAVVAEGYGFSMPDGFVHPEAPQEMFQEGRAAWKRAVETATSSINRMFYVRVWRRRSIALPPKTRELPSGPRSLGG